ncbi:MAG: Alpha-L-fucosidase [Candidatus Saccharicenans subterraneus]|uniref:alpha-L-fucosidase n=1 Tax=Candidatus Saccharicenans subterraneus TaxID=2508984 RepID=A0A3E2BPD5_9BACT|nr:MAG: Alpha-L-fucosidase [Candidatus Saccharicenans subterraneum]
MPAGPTMRLSRATKILPALFLATFIALSSLVVSRGQPTEITFRNVQIIEPGDPPDIIILKAARVVPTRRQIKWQEKELAAFVHFGLNTFTDQEHGDGTASPSLFQPSAFNPRQWARVFKEAGFRMIILTAKHHDGFCLWPTRTTEYSVKSSSWRKGKGDVVREVAMACREEGLDFGLYLSPWDRHEKSYGSPQYNEFFRRQLKELLSDYGPVAEVWFDGYCGEGPNGRKQDYDWNSYYQLIRKLQPEAVIAIMGPDVRWVGNESGLARESEWSVLPLNISEASLNLLKAGRTPLERIFQPANVMGEDLGSREVIGGARALFWYPAEVDVSIRPGWFYHQDQDRQVKSPPELFEIYLKSVGRNSVLLLNVPPDRRGLVNENDVRALRGWRQLLDQTFKEGYIKKTAARASGQSPGTEASYLVRKNPDGVWSPPPGQFPAWLEFTLERNSRFDCLEIREDISRGQRIEDFSVEAWLAGKWTEIAGGTTVGYKRLLTFSPVSADRVRLVIRQSRDVPRVKSFNLYRLAHPAARPAGNR